MLLIGACDFLRFGLSSSGELPFVVVVHSHEASSSQKYDFAHGIKEPVHQGAWMGTHEPPPSAFPIRPYGKYKSPTGRVTNKERMLHAITKEASKS
jgi:hypothetical protein